MRRKNKGNSTKKTQRKKHKKERKQRRKESKATQKAKKEREIVTKTMASFFYSSAVLGICALVLVLLGSSSIVHASGSQHQLGWIPTRSPCKGTIAECLAGGEFELDTEISRRILATSNYISYGALRRNSVPCSRRGASYYNCQPGAQANPYSRGCSAITRCR